jgi:hypothetical protein
MKWASRKTPDQSGPPHTAIILDWSEAFAARVMSRIHEYDDRWPKPFNTNTVVRLEQKTFSRPKRSN